MRPASFTAASASMFVRLLIPAYAVPPGTFWPSSPGTMSAGALAARSLASRKPWNRPPGVPGSW